jgi:hypothetical protein
VCGPGLVHAAARPTDQMGDLVAVGRLHPVDPLLKAGELYSSLL